MVGQRSSRFMHSEACEAALELRLFFRAAARTVLHEVLAGRLHVFECLLRKGVPAVMAEVVSSSCATCVCSAWKVNFFSWRQVQEQDMGQRRDAV